MTPAPPAGRLPTVDGLTGIRALAALWVLAHHLNAIVGPRIITVPIAGFDVDVTPFLTCGWVGVDLFFVLSGFLLTRQLLEAFEAAGARGAVPRFLLHRVLRVYPAYLAQIAILLGAAWIASGSPPPALRYLPLHLAMLQSATPAAESAINGVYWTLTAEFWFYLLLPFAVAALAPAARRGSGALARRALAVYAVAVAAMLAFRALVMAGSGPGTPWPTEWAARLLPATLDVFAAGMVAAVAARAIARGELAPGRHASGMLVAGGLAGVVGMLYVMHHHDRQYWAGGAIFYVWHGITAMFVALVVLGTALDGRLSRVLFATGIARYLGETSYSLYLWHLPVALWVASRLPPGRDEAAYLAVAIVAVLAASSLSYHAVERPVLRRRSRVERWLGLAPA